jgi:deoxyribodipyrimidine photolyase
LESICGGNVHEKGEVVLAVSSIHDYGGNARWEMKHAVDHKIDTDFCVNNNGIDWICCHFKNRVIEPIN